MHFFLIVTDTKPLDLSKVDVAVSATRYNQLIDHYKRLSGLYEEEVTSESRRARAHAAKNRTLATTIGTGYWSSRSKSSRW